jgi:hypothetical protein
MLTLHGKRVLSLLGYDPGRLGGPGRWQGARHGLANRSTASSPTSTA